MKVRRGAAYRDPDAIVTCTRVPGRSMAVEQQIVPLEVASPGSVSIDYGRKIQAHRARLSLRHLVVAE